MKKVFIPLIITSFFLWQNTAWSQQVEEIHMNPNKVISNMSNRLLESMETDTSMINGGVDVIKSYMRANVLPNINFEGMTAAAVGLPWRDATERQRKQIQIAYESLLLKSYMSALANLSGKKLEVLPSRATIDDTEVIVRSHLVDESGKTTKLNYRMFKTPSGWKIQDVGVDGVWLNNSYRSQFSSIIRKNGLDGLIKLLQDRAG